MPSCIRFSLSGPAAPPSTTGGSWWYGYWFCLWTRWPTSGLSIFIPPSCFWEVSTIRIDTKAWWVVHIHQRTYTMYTLYYMLLRIHSLPTLIVRWLVLPGQTLYMADNRSSCILLCATIWGPGVAHLLHSTKDGGRGWPDKLICTCMYMIRSWTDTPICPSGWQLPGTTGRKLCPSLRLFPASPGKYVHSCTCLVGMWPTATFLPLSLGEGKRVERRAVLFKL